MFLPQKNLFDKILESIHLYIHPPYLTLVKTTKIYVVRILYCQFTMLKAIKQEFIGVYITISSQQATVII